MNNNSFGVINRYFKSFTVVYKNHYDVLGLTPKATQSEIKSAYYKLSKIYHPDKNKGSESANEKFKDITAAYEVLGNFGMRKLYDRGLGSHQGIGKNWVADDEKIFESKGARIQTSKGTFTGRTPIYDFDEWSRNHYGHSIERRAHAKAHYEQKLARSSNSPKGVAEKENVMFSIILVFTLFLAFCYAYESSLDQPCRSTNQPK